MASSSTATKFQFRESDISNDSDMSSSISSVSIDNGDKESELQSMTGKGIKRLCAELVEIKALSDQDFHRNIYSNYSAFPGIFENVKNMEEELMQLKEQVLNQKVLVRELIDGVYLKLLSEETIESTIEDSALDELPPSNELEAHFDDFSEILNTLLSENRIDEAIAILEMEEENLQRVLVDENTPSATLISYKSVISERKAMLKLQLTLVAENSRISASELHKTLVGICRLGESHLATQLLLKNYHSRIVNGIRDLHSSSFFHGAYVRQLSKFVFSMISQAARSFVKLYGETSPFASEFIKWVSEEIEVFAVSFARYVKSISMVSSRLSTVVESVQFAMSYCSLLESQRLVLRPCLIELIRPSIDEVFQIYIDHLKKVIGIFTATDYWVLGRYLLSEILNESYSCLVMLQREEYYLLTNSGRKFLTVLQAITIEVTPLVELHLEDSVLRGLTELFSEYIAIVERAITFETSASGKSDSTIILAETVSQQVSILANLSTLKNLFFGTVSSVFGGTNHIVSEIRKNRSVGSQPQELESCAIFIQDASARIRAHFFQQFICRMVSPETSRKMIPQKCGESECDPGLVHHMMPSVPFQVLFLELGNLGKLTGDDAFKDWLMELLRELIGSVYDWILLNKGIWKNNGENLSFQDPDTQYQFILDMHFLVEIIRYGGYFSLNPLVPATLMKSAFDSVGLDPARDADDGGGWVTKAAIEAIERLLVIEEMDAFADEKLVGNSVEEPSENHSEDASETVKDDGRSSLKDSLMSEADIVITNASEVAIHTREVISNAESNHARQSPNLLKDKGRSTVGTTTCLINISGHLEDTESENSAYDRFHFDQETSLPHLLLSMAIGEDSEAALLAVEGVTGQLNEAKASQLEEDAEMNLPETEIVSLEVSTTRQGH